MKWRHAVLLGLLLATSLAALHGYNHFRNRRLAAEGIKRIATVVVVYRGEFGVTPADHVAALTEQNYVSASDLVDPWQTPYAYARSAGGTTFTVRSFGADAAPGGWGADKDLVFASGSGGFPSTSLVMERVCLALLLVSAAIMLWPLVVRPLQRRARCRAGLCPRCRYDLLLSGVSRCPECGFGGGTRTDRGSMKRNLRRLMRYPWRRARLFIGLGIVVTVAVAWTSAVTVEPVSRAQPEVQTAGAGPAEVWVVRRWSVPTASIVYSQRFSGTAKKKEAPETLVPYWTGYDTPVDNAARAESPLYESRMADSRGWPCAALWTEIHDPFSPQVSIRWGYEQTRGQPMTQGGPRIRRALPLRPIAIGFLADTLFFAALLYLPFLPFDVRRWRRRRQQRCLACGYPVGGSPVCTECGRAVA